MSFCGTSTTKIDLSPDPTTGVSRWIEVRDYLPVGELRRAAAARQGFGPDGSVILPMAMAFSQSVFYLVDWNLKHPTSGKDVAIDTFATRVAAVDYLDKATYDEIELAIATHILKKNEELVEKKKTPLGLTP